MKTYQFPRTDLSVSRIALGCMTLGGSWDASIPLDTEAVTRTRRIVETALELGINFFDHADIYCSGKSEEAFGRVLKDSPTLRPRMVLQSKCGIRFRGNPTPASPARYDHSYEHIVRSAEDTLKRLGIDRLDILLLHRPDPLAQPAEVARAFDHLQQSGKVRYFGLSNHSASQTELFARTLRQPLVVNQLQLSLDHPWLIDEAITVNQRSATFSGNSAGLLDYCRLNNILVQAWSPSAHGRFSWQSPDREDRDLRIANEVAAVASECDTNPDAVVLAWLLRHPAGIQPILGTTNPKRLRDAAHADTIDLTREHWWRLLAATRSGRVP